DAAWQGDNPIMGEHVFKQRIDGWIVDIRRQHSFLQVVQNDQAWAAAKSSERCFMQLGPDARTRTECQKPNGFAAVAESHDKQPRPPILSGLWIAHHRSGAVIDLGLFTGCRDDDSDGIPLPRSAQLANETLDALIITSEAVFGDHVLPDRHRITATTERQF